MAVKKKMFGRKKPYTQIGIGRMPCFRCGKPSTFQWTICSDNNLYRPICLSCDIKLNKMVLIWAGFPDWEEKIEAYKKRVL